MGRDLCVDCGRFHTGRKHPKAFPKGGWDGLTMQRAFLLNKKLPWAFLFRKKHPGRKTYTQTSGWHLQGIHLHICSSSHLYIFSASHLLIFTSSHLDIFSSSHPHILTSSHLHILTSSHLHVFTFSLALLLSCPLALSFFSISLLKARGSANETARNATLSHETRFVRQKLR